jgi:hypothetical protein
MAIKPSPHFALLLLFIYLTAAIVVYFAAIPTAFRLGSILLIILSLSHYLARDFFLFFSDSWNEFSFDQNGVTVVARNGSTNIATVSNTTIVCPYFIVLRVRFPGQYRLVSRVIFPDALNAGEFRKLCVLLKLY